MLRCCAAPRGPAASRQPLGTSICGVRLLRTRSANGPQVVPQDRCGRSTPQLLRQPHRPHSRYWKIAEEGPSSWWRGGCRCENWQSGRILPPAEGREPGAAPPPAPPPPRPPQRLASGHSRRPHPPPQAGVMAPFPRRRRLGPRRLVEEASNRQVRATPWLRHHRQPQTPMPSDDGWHFDPAPVSRCWVRPTGPEAIAVGWGGEGWGMPENHISAVGRERSVPRSTGSKSANSRE